MNTFAIEHAVDFSTGVAKIGKVHVISKRDYIMSESLQKRIEKASKAREGATK